MMNKKLITKLTNKINGICYKMNTEKFKYEPNYMFEKGID